MAFTPETLSIIVQPIGGEGMRMISYRTDDDQATVTGTDYFADSERFGLRLHDLIFISAISADFDPYIVNVTEVDAEGNVTVAINDEEMLKSIYDPQGIAADAFDVDNHTSGTTNKVYTAAEQTKLSNIEANADVTDTANVDAAGATMNTDTDVSSYSWVLDEDDFASNSATKVPTQQSVKAYADSILEFPLPNYNVNARARSMPDRLEEDGSVSVKEFAAYGAACGEFDFTAKTGTDDTDAANNAIAFAVAEGLPVKFPRTPVGKGYGLSDPIVIENDDLTIKGAGPGATILVAKENEDIFQFDVRTEYRENILIRDMGFRCSATSFDGCDAFHVLGDNTVTAGLRHSTFQNIKLWRLEHGFYAEETLGGGGALSGAGQHQFNNFLNWQVPLQTQSELPLSVSRFPTTFGAHNVFAGGQYRARPSSAGGSLCAIEIGNGANWILGDLLIAGIHFNYGRAGIHLNGPTGGSYNSNISIVGCQPDNMDTYSFDLENLNTLLVSGCNLQNNPPNISNCTNYFVEDPVRGFQRHRSDAADYDEWDASLWLKKRLLVDGRATFGGYVNRGDPDDVTISSGAISITSSHVRVDTEGAAASDDLDNINGGADYDEIIIRTANSSRDVTVKHATGNIRLDGSADKTLSSLSDVLTLIRLPGPTWVQKSFSNNV